MLILEKAREMADARYKLGKLEAEAEYSGNEYHKLKNSVSQKETELIELLQLFIGNEDNNPLPQTFIKKI